MILINKIKSLFHEVKDKINKNNLHDCEVIYNSIIDVDIHEDYLNTLTHLKLSQMYNKLEQTDHTCDLYIYYIDSICLVIKEFEEIKRNNSYFISSELKIELEKEINILQSFLSQLVKNTSSIPINDLYIAVEKSINEIKEKIKSSHYNYCFNMLVSKFNQCRPELMIEYNRKTDNIENQIKEIGNNIRNSKFDQVDKSIDDIYKLLPTKISSPIHTHSLPNKRRKKNESVSNVN